METHTHSWHFRGASLLILRDMSVQKSWFWAGKNYGPIFLRLWTKVHQLHCNGTFIIIIIVYYAKWQHIKFIEHYRTAITMSHRHRLHGGDRGDCPHGQKVVGAMSPSRHQTNFVKNLLPLNTAEMYSKNYEYDVMQVTKDALISAWKCFKSVWRLGWME